MICGWRLRRCRRMTWSSGRSWKRKLILTIPSTSCPTSDRTAPSRCASHASRRWRDKGANSASVLVPVAAPPATLLASVQQALPAVLPSVAKVASATLVTPSYLPSNLPTSLLSTITSCAILCAYTLRISFLSSLNPSTSFSLFCPFRSQRERWVDALQPDYYSVPSEISYDTWGRFATTLFNHWLACSPRVSILWRYQYLNH